MKYKEIKIFFDKTITINEVDSNIINACNLLNTIKKQDDYYCIYSKTISDGFALLKKTLQEELNNLTKKHHVVTNMLISILEKENEE